MAPAGPPLSTKEQIMNKLPEWLPLLVAALNLIATALRLAANRRRAASPWPEADPTRPERQNKEGG
jgi:hypothetical protein